MQLTSLLAELLPRKLAGMPRLTVVLLLVPLFMLSLLKLRPFSEDALK